MDSMSSSVGTTFVAAAAVATALVLAACGGGATSQSTGPSAASSSAGTAAPESNPAGDIPDTQVYVPFTPPEHMFTVSVPEGWAKTTDGKATVFTDKLNTVRIEMVPRAAAPNTESVSVDELPAVAAATPGYRKGSVSAVQRNAGDAIQTTYEATSAPNAVTGKSGVDAVERYEFWRNGHEVILTLSGPVGADNVDPWRTITDSFQWQ
jgi:hypothetical protein